MASRSFGTLRCHVECSACGVEVQFSYLWDRSVGVSGQADDTEHTAPDGSPCNLSDADIERGANDAAERREVPCV